MAWALANLTEPVTVEDAGPQAHMSTRTYLRHFKLASGTSPIRWLIAQRVQASLPLLETTSASIEQIAAAAGFDTAATYRHHFGRAMRTSPTAYRRAFRDGPPRRAWVRGAVSRRRVFVRWQTDGETTPWSAGSNRLCGRSGSWSPLASAGTRARPTRSIPTPRRSGPR